MKKDEIRERALFIADAHYPHHGEALMRLLRAIEAGSVVAPQLFLMGDIFDLLFGYNDYIRSFSQEAIDLLRAVAQKVECHYFEGNHDFCLAPIFGDLMQVYAYTQQPRRFRYGEQIVGLSHGDRFDAGIAYTVYTKLLRNKTTLTLLRPWEKRIIDDRMQKLKQKKICKHYERFEHKIARIMQHYGDVDKVIEGHFHQGKNDGTYVSLPSLACQNAVGIAQNGEIRFVALDALIDSA